MAKYHYWLTEEGLTRLRGWAMDGLTDEQIAENIGIALSTIYAWKNKYLEISDALKRGKDFADREVENALHKRAKGYEYIETKTIIGVDGKKRIEKTTKHMAPDPTAAIFWLKNRKPEQWRDRKISELAGNIKVDVEWE